MTAALLFDTSVLIPMINTGRYEETFRRAMRSGRALLCSVVLQELYAGTADVASKRDLDRLNRSFVLAGAIVTPEHDDWTAAGIILARYGRLRGRVARQDHLADVLITLCAARRSAILVTENVRDMARWAALARPRAGRPSIRAPDRIDTAGRS
jgi:predicted nucleic acid-binding protein